MPITKTQFLCALRMLLVLTALTGVVYPVVVTVIAQLAFPRQANGSLVHRSETTVGSELLAQSFTDDTHFWPRPSAASFTTVPSGASNKGPTAGDLHAAVAARGIAFRTAHGLAADARVPSDMLFASGSGLDPHVSPESARLQMDRVARARQFNTEQKQRLTELVTRFTEPPQLGFLGEPRVNILLLNLALDDLK